MYKNNWETVLNEARDAFCFNVGMASVEAKYRHGKRFAKRVCYAHNVLQKIEKLAIHDKFNTTVIKYNFHLFNVLFKKLMKKEM